MKDAQTSERVGGAAAPARRAPRFSVEALKMPLGIVGALLILGGLGYYLIFSAFDTPARILLASGILLVGIAVAIDPEAVWGKMTTRNALYGGNTFALAVIFLGILVLINVLGARRSERWDLTANKRYSLSDETITVLQKLDRPIQATAFFSVDDSRRRDLEELFHEYEVRSNNQFTYQFVDPVEAPGLAQQLGVRELGTTVLTLDTQKQQVTGTQEQDITTGIIKLVQPSPKKAYFTIGHNEHGLDATAADGYSQVKTQLESRNFIVAPLNLFASGAVPDDANVVVIAGPKQPLSDEERAAIQAYLDKGGNLILLGDPGVDAGLGQLLAQWNVELGQAYVVDTDRSSFYRTPFNPVASRFPAHKITDQMPPVVFLGTTYLTLPKQPKPNVTVSPLAQTSDQSWAETDPNALKDPQAIKFDDGSDTRGPLVLGAAIEVRPDSATPPTDPQSPPKAKNRIVVFGTSRLVTNDVFQLPVGNPSLLVNAASWAAGEEDLISIKARPEDNRNLFLSAAQENFVLVSSVLFVPALVLAAGVAVWWSRR
ncbi:MAG: GldG family protein [Chloroflexi bacterium]|nr:GldG family protein [Chloroflexota bacterium]